MLAGVKLGRSVLIGPYRTPGGPTVRPARPDASMSLLREAVERAVDPAYALAAARRTDAQRPHPRRTRAAVALLAVALGAGTTTAVASLRAPAPAGQRQALLDEIAARSAVADAAAARVADLRAQVDARARTTSAGPDLAAATTTAAALAATSPLRGPGLRLVLDDAAGARTPPPGTDPRAADPRVRPGWSWTATCRWWPTACSPPARARWPSTTTA